VNTHCETNLTTELLELTDTASLPATSEPFALSESFMRAPRIRFSVEFKKRFQGTVESPMPSLVLCRYKLLKIAHDAPIIEELGGKKKVEGKIAAAFALLARQGSGEPGFLQTNGFANIFYLRSQNRKGELCAVRFGWEGARWYVDAISVDDPYAWNGTHEIFAPDLAA
jgi:hypothetical protein